MNVRKAAGTTLSLIVLIVGLVYLLPIIRNALPYDVLFTLAERLLQKQFIGVYYLFVIKFSIWIIIVVGVLDAILRNKVAFGLLSSLNILIVMGIPVITVALTLSVNAPIFWGVMQFAVIIGIYWTFRKVIHNNHADGQKLIPFIKEIKVAGVDPNVHIFDHYVVFWMSLTLVAAFFLTVISILIYVVTNWNVFV